MGIPPCPWAVLGSLVGVVWGPHRCAENLLYDLFFFVASAADDLLAALSVV
jgi:hypothetical protein